MADQPQQIAPSDAKCRAPECTDIATVHAHLDDGRLLPLCGTHALELVPEDCWEADDVNRCADEDLDCAGDVSLHSFGLRPMVFLCRWHLAKASGLVHG